jgi:hypothetical protein
VDYAHAGINVNPVDHVPSIVGRLYELVAELERHFPRRKFTPDGHLVGSLGEVLAAYYYELDLLEASTPKHDAKSRDGRLVQVKATQGRSVALRSEPDHLLVLLIERDGTVEEVFNGPGSIPWARIGPPQKNGQYPLAVGVLRKLMASVPEDARLVRRP